MIKDYAEPDFWQCHFCGYSMTHTEYINLICDLGCPRCDQSLDCFIPRNYVKEGKVIPFPGKDE